MVWKNNNENKIRNMKYSIKFLLFMFAVVFISSCNDMNDSINEYMKNGERIYIGIPDSIKTFSGRQRFQLSLLLKDPRIDTLAIYWNQKGDSILLPVGPHKSDSLFKFAIGGGTLAEGNYVLQFISRSRGKFKSMLVESSVNVYGSRYEAKLISRYAKTGCSYRNSTSRLSLNWGSAVNATEKGILIRFYSKWKGMEKDTFISSESLAKLASGALVIQNVSYNATTRPVSYRTMYLPEATSIDTFYTKRDTIKSISVLP